MIDQPKSNDRVPTDAIDDFDRRTAELAGKMIDIAGLTVISRHEWLTLSVMPTVDE